MASVTAASHAPKCARALLLLTLGSIFAVSPTVDAQAVAAQGAIATPAKSVAGKLPEFEVATIKPVDPKAIGQMGVVHVSPGKVVLNDYSLKGLICLAFNLSYYQISGGDDWTGKLEYHVEAKPPEDLQSCITDLRHSLFGIEDEHLRLMFQALLIDRFQLKYHIETKTGQVYLLEKSGKKLQMHPSAVQPANPDSLQNAVLDSRESSIGWAELWNISNTSMPQLAKFASDYCLHRPVLDRTGLTGLYDYRTARETAEEVQYHKSDPTGSFLSFIQEMGLKMQTANAPVETFVIDHAELPSPN